MRLGLIQVRDRGDIVGQRLEPGIGPPAEGLYGYAQVFLEMDRVHDVPSVQAPFRRAVLSFVVQHITDIRGGVSLRKTVAPAEIIFRTGAADGRIRIIAVDEEFDFALAEPVVRQLRPRQKRADVLSLVLRHRESYNPGCPAHRHCA